MFKKIRSGNIFDWVLIVVGCAISAIGYSTFLVPAQIVSGGVSGIAMIIHHFLSLPVGAVSFVINVPLFIIGWKQVGRKFAIHSFVAMTLFSLFSDLFQFGPFTNDLILSGVYGGVIFGIGLGLVLRAGASTGGSDLAAQVLRKAFPAVSTSNILFGLDFVVIAVSALFFSVEQALYGVLSLFVSTKFMEMMLDGFNAARAFWIISDKEDEIVACIYKELDRGCTLVDAEGSYTGQKKHMLLCIVARSETSTMNRLIYQTYPAAFYIINDSSEVLGEGFDPHK